MDNKYNRNLPTSKFRMQNFRKRQKEAELANQDCNRSDGGENKVKSCIDKECIEIKKKKK